MSTVLLDPMAVVQRLRDEREISEALAVDAWRLWLATEHDGVLALSDRELADRTDLWKWMFPIGGHARAGSPRIGRRRMRVLIDADTGLRSRLLRSWARLLAYLQLQEVGGRVLWISAPAPWAQDRTRVSRMLRCVHNAGLADEARSMRAFLEAEVSDRQDAVRWWRHQLAS